MSFQDKSTTQLSTHEGTDPLETCCKSITSAVGSEREESISVDTSLVAASNGTASASDQDNGRLSVSITSTVFRQPAQDAEECSSNDKDGIAAGIKAPWRPSISLIGTAPDMENKRNKVADFDWRVESSQQLAAAMDISDSDSSSESETSDYGSSTVGFVPDFGLPFTFPYPIADGFSFTGDWRPCSSAPSLGSTIYTEEHHQLAGTEEKGVPKKQTEEKEVNKKQKTAQGYHASEILVLMLLAVTILVFSMWMTTTRSGVRTQHGWPNWTSPTASPTQANFLSNATLLAAEKGDSLAKVATERKLNVGLDTSEAKAAEDAGVQFFGYNQSETQPALEIVQQNGYGWVRLRVMVHPNTEFALYQDLDYVLSMAKEAKLRKLKVLLAFHYSHWWGRGDGQWISERWQDAEDQLSLETLCGLVYNHTREVMQALVDDGLSPDAVQIGNDITNGILWDYGKLPHDWADRPWHTSWYWMKSWRPLPQEWYNLKDLIQSGIDAIRDVVTIEDDRPLIVLHLGSGGDKDYTEEWMQAYFRLGGECDVIGLSWFPMFGGREGGSMQQLKTNIDNLSAKFPKQQVWLVETGHYYNLESDCRDFLCHNDKWSYQTSEDGQYAFLRDLRTALLQTECRAVFYWGSHWAKPTEWFSSPGDDEPWREIQNRALFDRQGRALKGFLALVGR